MITQELLRRIQQKNPKFTTNQIKNIITHHMGAINLKLANCQTIKLKVPKLGIIHTHGNVKNFNRVNINKAHLKIFHAKSQYTDAQLLF